MTPAFEATTAGITVGVRAVYLTDRSEPANNLFVWAYQIRITNRSETTVQLLARHWRITDARGRVQTVAGDGVVGEQPVLEPGASFEYTSGTPLPTPSGFMAGTYQMIRTATGQRFEVAIPSFSLDSPHQDARLH